MPLGSTFKLIEQKLLADALSRIYSDEQEGVIRADSEYVNDRDEPIRGKRPKTHPIYVDSALIESMNAEVRRSSRLADKPEINYNENRERKAKVDRTEILTTKQDIPELTEQEDEPEDTGGRGGHTWQVHCEFVERF